MQNKTKHLDCLWHCYIMHYIRYFVWFLAYNQSDKVIDSFPNKPTISPIMERKSELHNLLMCRKVNELSWSLWVNVKYCRGFHLSYHCIVFSWSMPLKLIDLIYDWIINEWSSFTLIFDSLKRTFQNAWNKNIGFCSCDIHKHGHRN